MGIVADTIQAIVEAQGLKYVRSVNINDLNEQLGGIDIAVAGGVGVYSSLPSVNNITFGLTNTVLSEYSIEVYYLQLNEGVDDKGSQIDIILDNLFPLANGLYDVLRRSDLVARNVPIEGYTIDSVETLKLSKEVVSGWRVQMNLPIYREVFDCVT